MTSLRFIEQLRGLVDGVEVILSDIWGVVHNGLESFPEACEALHTYRQRGGTVILITNAPRPADSVQRRTGFGECLEPVMHHAPDVGEDHLDAIDDFAQGFDETECGHGTGRRLARTGGAARQSGIAGCPRRGQWILRKRQEDRTKEARRDRKTQAGIRRLLHSLQGISVTRLASSPRTGLTDFYLH